MQKLSTPEERAALKRAFLAHAHAGEVMGIAKALIAEEPALFGAGSARRPEAATGEGGCCDGDVSDDWRSPASSRSSPSRLLSGCACAETSSSARERRAV